MNAITAMLLAMLRPVDTAFVRAATDEELEALYRELDTALLFVRHERQRREENAE
jgi:hypothetical protein